MPARICCFRVRDETEKTMEGEGQLKTLLRDRRLNGHYSNAEWNDLKRDNTESTRHRLLLSLCQGNHVVRNVGALYSYDRRICSSQR